jgi:hypothetical protein
MREMVSTLANQLAVAIKDFEHDLPTMVDDARIATQRPESGSKNQKEFAVAPHTRRCSRAG